MRSSRVGVLTCAIALIAVGIFIVLHVFGYATYESLRYFCPALIILFGIEVLWRRYVGNAVGRIRFSGWSIALICIIALGSLIQSSVLHHFHGLGFRVGPAYTAHVQGQIATVHSIKRVDIEVRDARVMVTGTTNSTVKYAGDLVVPATSQAQADKDIHSEWQVRTVGDTLYLQQKENHPIQLQFDLGGPDRTPYLNVWLPEDLMTHVTTTNGSIKVLQMQADSSIQTTNGSIEVDGLKGNLTAGSTNGPLQLHDIAGTISAQTTNGPITVASSVEGNWQCTTTNGQIQLAVPHTASANIDASTSNGGFHGDVAWQMDGKNHGQCTVGGGKYRVHLETSNGDVQVNYAK